MVIKMYTFMVVELENGGKVNMPIYEYQCIKCDALTEEFEKVSAMKKVIPCSVCGAPADKITSLTQKIQPYEGAMRQEEKIERTTEVQMNLNTKTGDRKVYERPQRLSREERLAII